MQPLHHRSGAGTRELHQPAGQRTGDAERVGHMLRIQPQQNPGRHRRAERAGRAGRMKATPLVAVFRCISDAIHHLEPGNHGGDQFPPAAATLLRHRQPRRQQGGAGMHAGARLRQVVGLEGMRQRPIRQRRRRCLHQRPLRAEDAAAPACPDTLRIGGNDAAPWQAIAQHDHRDRIGDAVLGALYHVRRQILVAQARRIFGQANRFVCHRCSPLCRRRYPVMRGNPRRGVPSRPPRRYRAAARA